VHTVKYKYKEENELQGTIPSFNLYQPSTSSISC